MRLYELTSDFLAFLEAIENEEIPEDAIADTLESITAGIEEKADSIACMLKSLAAEITAIRAEEIRLAERRKVKERQQERIREYLSESLLRAGIDKVDTARCRITFRKSESVEVIDDTAFSEWAMTNRDDLLTYSQPSINRTAIKSALKNGEEIPFVQIAQKQNIQIK